MGGRQPNGSPSFVRLIFWLLTSYFLFQLLNGLSRDVAAKSISADQLTEAIQTDEVQQLVFVPESLKILGVLKKTAPDQAIVNFETRAVGDAHLETIRQLAEQKKIPYKVQNPPNPWMGIFWMSILPMLIFIGFIFYQGKKQTDLLNGKNGPFGLGKSSAKRFQPSQIMQERKTFDDVAGCDEAKEELQEIVEFLKNPGHFTRLGARIPRGILLVGEPGTGKTLLARAVAGEANVPFLSASGSEFIELFVGMGAARVRNLFNEAKSLAPCIVFIDEIDAVGKKRGVAIGGGHDEREQTLNQLLTELDGFTGNTRIIVIVATNRPDVLDEALIRPGRFDRHVQVPRPDFNGRELILKVHIRNVPLNQNVNLADIAKDTAGMVGADLENVVNEAVLIATRRNTDKVEQSDFSEAVDKVSMGPMRKSEKFSDKEKKITAYHEAGHTLVATLLKDQGADPVHKVTIIPRGPALGFTKQLPENDHHLYTKMQLESMVAVCVGGRAAEEIIFNEVTSGAANDFQKATGILRKMIYELGMHEGAGLVVHKEKTDFWGNPTGLDASQATKELLENILKKELERIYQEVKKMLQGNQVKLDTLATALLEKETLDAKEIMEIIQSA